jgi:hypothetical protein
MSANLNQRRFRGIVALQLMAGLSCLALGALPPEQVEFFEQKVRPVLVEHCYPCHSASSEKVRGGLRLDSRADTLKGGTDGVVLHAGHPEDSLLISAVKGTAKDLKRMPLDKEPLKGSEIAALEEWIRLGAPDPRDGTAVAASPAGTHWAFRPPVAPPIPQISAQPGEVENPIDSFLGAKRREKGLLPTSRADRRTLLRRVTFDLTGLPPTPEETRAFLEDRSQSAWATVVDRLLASPRYGERWGRHWLDVARYADSKGYVFEQERRFSHSYTYRDWVIHSLNADLPYDQFLLQQIAGDKIATQEDPWPMAALGFLTLGRRFLDSNPDIIDDRIDVVFRGTQGLTVGCARCHDHKYDPIPTADYYSLYGVFDSSHEPGEKPFLGKNPNERLSAQYEEERKKREKELADFRAERTADVLKKLRDHVADYLLAAQDSMGLDWTNLEGLARVRSLDPGLVGAWKNRLESWRGSHHPVFAAWFALAAVPTNDFAAAAKPVLESFKRTTTDKPLNAAVVAALTEPAVENFKQAAERIGKLIVSADAAWSEALANAKKGGTTPPAKLPDPAQEELRLVLDAENSPVQEAMRDIDRFFDTPTGQKVRALRRKLDELDATHPGAPLRAMALLDNDKPSEPVVFKRGNPGNPGPKVPRQMPAIVSGNPRKPFVDGSGRLELAKAIVRKDNPLTARVMVNRVWMQYFGSPLVRTPSDFGTRADPPTQPELLDHLAVWFMDHDWSMKELHRYIVSSATYQQVSDPGDDAEMVRRFAANEKLDAGNVHLWKMNRKRLDFESFRDSLLAVSGTLDGPIGGQPVAMYEETDTPRRTLYGFIDRQNLPGVLRVFDFAIPDATSPMRFQTTVPQQALFVLNSPFFAQRAVDFANRPDIAGIPGFTGRIARMHELAYQRPPSQDESKLALEFLEHPIATAPSVPASANWSYGTGEFDAQSQRTKNWKALPHFTGEAWQWEEKLPSKSGEWTMLTKSGGHPGHTAAASAIRRWTAPASGKISVTAHLEHPADQGDGVIGRLVSSRSGQLGQWEVFHRKQPTSIAEIEVVEGETLDFVVEPGKDENSDSFKWSPTLNYLSGGPVMTASAVREWNAARDFGGLKPAPKPLTAWEQYAQILLSANEFVFVD